MARQDGMVSVLHIIDTGGPGGAETVFLQTATSLDPARFRSTAVVGGHGWLAEQIGERAAAPFVVPAKGSFNVRYLLQLSRIAREVKAQVIVAHLYGSAVYAGLLGKMLSIPVVSILHGQTDVPSTERFAGLKSALVRSGSRRVVFVSERLREHLEPRLRIAPPQAVVIPNGVDTTTFQPSRDTRLRAELRLSDETLLIGAIGNVRRPKAYDVLLRAVRALRDRSANFHVAIVGDHTNALAAELFDLARQLGIEQHVTFLGLRGDVSRILNNLDAFVLTSRTEGFSIACIEAMACGVPVVATRSGGPEEILEDGAGILVPVDDPAAIADALERVTTSKALGASLAAKGLARVHERYSLSRMLARYEALLESVASESRRGRGVARASGPLSP